MSVLHQFQHQCLWTRLRSCPAVHSKAAKSPLLILSRLRPAYSATVANSRSVLCERPSLALATTVSTHFLQSSHREGDSHHCNPPKQEPTEPKNAEAHALLDRYFRDIPQKPAASSATPRTPKLPTDPVKLARYEALELMKLRHRAKPADPKETNVAQPDRVHVRVNQVGRPAADAKLLWFKKVC